MIQEAAVEKPSLQKQKVQQFVYEAKFTHQQEDALVEATQLLAGTTLRKALVKFERWTESRGLRDVDLMSLAVRADMVV
jgi:hypothetical protein